jgi:hypothetical protein
MNHKYIYPLTNITLKIISFNLDHIERLLETKSHDQLYTIEEEMKNEIKKGNAIGFEKEGDSYKEISVFHDALDLFTFYNKFIGSKSHLLFTSL